MTALEARVRVSARSLEGMQKEAIVDVGSASWRMVSDEGPYLEGTDLAPFPLAFFSAGMQFSLLSRLCRSSEEAGIVLRAADLVQDNYYSMEGSFLRGDALGGARPAELELRLQADGPPEAIERLVRLAHRSDPAHAVMRDPLANTFALVHRGRRLPLEGLMPSPTPRTSFELPASFSDGTAAVEKVASAVVVHGVEGGAGSSLAPEQKRSLHIHGEARIHEDGLFETTIRLFKPIGSTFRFRCDSGGSATAPPPLAYLCAGVAFCYLTQLGRYARIKRIALDSYAVFQEAEFHLEGSAADESLVARASPFDTQVFLEGGLTEGEARDLVRMGERTCFLHASMRGVFPSLLSWPR